MDCVEALREPGRCAARVEATATRPRDWPRGPARLDAAIIGASSAPNLDDFIALTSTTASIVVDDGVRVYEWYADRVGSGDRLLGNSSAKAALALLLASRRGSGGDGMRRPFVSVDPVRRVGVVKMSVWPNEDPWWDRQGRDLRCLALPANAGAAIMARSVGAVPR